MSVKRHHSFLGRWYGMASAHALSFFLVLAPLLTGQRLFADPDGLSFTYPFNILLSPTGNQLSGTTLWNHLNFHGFPSSVGENALMPLLLQLLSPSSLSPVVYHWIVFLNLIGGGLFFSLFLRSVHISELAAWIGGLTYVTSMWWILPWITGAMMLPTIPLLLWSLTRSKAHTLSSTFFTTLILTYAWYCMYWVHLPFLWITGILFAGCLTWQHIRARRSLFLSPLFLLFLAFVFSLFLSLPKILPTLLYANLSLRGGGLNWSDLTIGGATALTPVHALFPFLEIPLLSFGQAPIFIGAFSLAAAIIALTKRTHIVRSLAIGYLFFFLLALHRSPLLWLLHTLPPFSYIRREGLWLTVGNVAAAGLTAIGCDMLAKDEAPHARKWIGNIACWIAALSFVVSVIVSLSLHFFEEGILTFLTHIFDTYFSGKTSGLPLAHYHAVIQDYVKQLGENLSLLSPHYSFPLFALFLLAGIFLEPVWRRLWSLRGGALALAALVSTIPILAIQHETISTRNFPPATITSQYLQEHPGLTYSVFPTLAKFLSFDQTASTLEDTVHFQMEFLIPNRNLWYHLPSIDYFDNFMSRRMGKLLAWIGSEHIQQTKFTRDIALAQQALSLEEKITLFLERKDILDILNTKTLLSPWPLRHPELLLRKTVALPPSNFPLYIYENTTARPFAYFASDIVVIPEDEEHAWNLLRKEQWKKKKTLLECEGDCAPLHPTGKGTIHVMEQEPTNISIQTKGKSPQWLIVSVNNLPGWRISIDGEQTNPAIAHTTFFGISVPTGSHTVSLHFSRQALCADAIAWVASTIRERFSFFGNTQQSVRGTIGKESPTPLAT